jgi:hypothetical protein
MRRRHSRLRAMNVTATLVSHLVGSLHLRDYKTAVPAVLLARLLLLCAANRQSLSFTAQHCDAAPSDESVRLALKYNLPDTTLALLGHLLAALHALVPARLRRRARPCALDLHERPFYGAVGTPGTTGGKRQAGTDYFWCYASLAVLTKGLRFNIGLCPVDRRQSLVVVVQTLLGQARAQGVRIAWLLLDRGFYDAQVVDHLKGQGLRFALPMIRRGDADRGTGTQPFFAAGCAAGWHDYTWVARPRVRDAQTGRKAKQPARAVSARVCVYHPSAGKAWVFLAWGINWDPTLLARRYRRRFGIETSYRQLGQCLAQTTNTDARVRLLYVGLALLLRQYWAWAHAEVLAVRLPGGCRRLQPHRLRLACLTLWLVLILTRWLGFRLEVESPNQNQSFLD